MKKTMKSFRKGIVTFVLDNDSPLDLQCVSHDVAHKCEKINALYYAENTSSASFGCILTSA